MAESLLWRMLVIIFCMIHGQQVVERGFNTNADIIVDNQSDHSLMALRMVHDHIRSYKELRQSVGKSRQCYQEYLEEQK